MYPIPGNQDWITSYGLTLIIALVTCWWLARRNAKAAGIDPSHINLVLPLAILGGFLFTALQPSPRIQLIPLIITCLVVVFAYSRITGMAFSRLADVFALPTLAAIAVQRIGCFLAGCCFGEPVGNDALHWLGVEFPAGSFAHEHHVMLGLIEPGAATSLAVHATQLYEAVLLVPLYLILRQFGGKGNFAGALTLAAIAGYAVVRFGIEFLRADSAAISGSFSVIQLVCVAVVLGAAIMSRMNTNAWR